MYTKKKFSCNIFQIKTFLKSASKKKYLIYSSIYITFFVCFYFRMFVCIHACELVIKRRIFCLFLRSLSMALEEFTGNTKRVDDDRNIKTLSKTDLSECIFFAINIHIIPNVVISPFPVSLWFHVEWFLPIFSSCSANDDGNTVFIMYNTVKCDKNLVLFLWCVFI